MTYFLERIATQLFDEFGDRLDRHCLVFPNRRAGLYFLKYLAGRSVKPVWSPQILTINELFQSFSVKQQAESEILVFELYRIYRELNKNAGSIDDFFFWGEMVVNDFDDADKYLIDASKLFINLENIKEIDTKFGGLTEEQIRIIKQFWVNFNPDITTDQKSGFKEIWSILLPMYSRFRDSLANRSIAYEGMIYRELAEKCKNKEPLKIKWDFIHFVGFNALNTCEKELMTWLKKSGYARFYWDYDNSFVHGNSIHSAGFFIRENLSLYGNDMPADWSFDSISAKSKSEPCIRVIDCSSDISQVKLASKLVEDSSLSDDNEAQHTAIVLADENLLLPMLTSLPENADSVNITMGYPLKFSHVFSLIKDLIMLQNTIRTDDNGEILFDYNAVKNILTNGFFTVQPDDNLASLLSDLNNQKEPWVVKSFFHEKQPFDFIFQKISSAREQSLYLKTILERLYILSDESESDDSVAVGINIRNEFLYRVILAINRLDAIADNNDPVISLTTYNRLLDRILKGLSIPFSGEPLSGIQVMGLLETRSLDFRNLIMLSVNEGILPQTSVSNSFIPYSLREAFGLPTIRHQDSIYAYYFYRLLQRAENITFIYNSSSDGLKSGEMSRFLLQLSYSENPPRLNNQRFEILVSARVPGEIKRNQSHIDILKEKYLDSEKKTLSPSAVNTWLTCKMKFYYSYVCGIKETIKVSREIDSAIFGELLHRVMEKIYSPYKNRILDGEEFGSILRDEDKINRIITDSINEKFYNWSKSKLSGNDLIICNILKSYIKQILKLDSRLAPLEILEMEYVISSLFEINYRDNLVAVKVGGVIDRFDRIGGIHRITDYKTGKIVMEIPSIESLFDETRKDRNESWFQILMYCLIYFEGHKNLQLRPAIYPVRSMYSIDFEDSLKIKDFEGQSFLVNDFHKVRETFNSLLIQTIESIFNPEISFIMTENLRKCNFCPYARLCQR